MRLAPNLLMLAPALVLVALLPALPGLVHGGGLDLIGRFALAALQPSLEPALLGSLLKGLAVTVGMALLGWATSLVLGLGFGVLGSGTVWRTVTGQGWPARLIRRLLALPRAIHELLWGLLLLQVLGLRPVVAVAAIALPYGALVARVVSDLLDSLDTRRVEALTVAGASAPAALLTAMGPAALPGVLSYGGYRLECALRSATLLGVFGLGGLGSDLRLSLQSLEFRELWSGLWLLLAVMLALETGLARLRRRWLMPPRLGLTRPSVGRRGREMVAALLALLPLVLLVGRALAVEPADLLAIRPLPGLAAADWRTAFALPWPQLLGNTLALTLLAAALAVGLAPLLLLLAAPSAWAGRLVRLGWAFARLWPPPLIALLLLFVLKPGLVTAALALGLHNLGVLGRLLAESLEDGPAPAQEALRQAGSGPRLALLYGGFSPVARSYLAYGAYRADVMLRETVVVGLVGAVGLGSALLESLSAFAWDRVAVLVGAYALLTLTGEELSERLRRRLAVRMAAV